MAHNGTMLGLWLVRDRAGETLLAKVQNEMYVLAFTAAHRANRARDGFGADGAPFLIVAANLRDVVDRARADGAVGFIVDYDIELARFASAHPLPAPAASTAAAPR
jgi:hypothetical protein